MILIDRAQELASLEKNYKSKKSTFGVVYGRRRIGKTALIKKFIEKKDSIYFLANQDYIEKEFVRFKEKIAKDRNIHLTATNFYDLFKEIIENESKKNKDKLIIVIDEFPYWILSDKSIPSKFQEICDELISKTNNFMLIVLGSYMSIIDTDVIGYNSPLYGRANFLLNLKELSIKSLPLFFKERGLTEQIKLFGLCDTIPFYLSLIDPKKSFENNLRNLLATSNIYFSDAQIILSAELRSYIVYIDILKCISEGATSISEIANKSKVDISNISKYLKNLLGLRIIEKIRPQTASEKERNYIYRVKDNYFNFWLKYVYPYMDNIELNLDNHLTFIIKDYNNYMGFAFERFCQRFIETVYKIPGTNWWTKNIEIDFVGTKNTDKQIYFGEIKWTENINAFKIASELNDKTKSVIWQNKNRTEILLIFAKSFTRKITSLDNKKVICYDLKDIEKEFKRNIKKY